MRGAVGPAVAVRNARVKQDRAAPVADADAVAVPEAEVAGIAGVEEGGGPRLLGYAGGRLGEARIEVVVRGRGDEAEGMLRVRCVDRLHMVGEGGHLGAARVHPDPVRLEAEAPVRPAEAVQVMGGLEVRHAVLPAHGLERRRIGMA